MAEKTETAKTPAEMGITDEAWDILKKIEVKAQTIETNVWDAGKNAGKALSDIVVALWKKLSAS